MELKPTNEELKLTIIDDSIIYLNDRIENFDIQLLVFLVGAYWAIGIPTCSCKVTITGRSSGLPIPSANSASFTITRP